MTEFTMKVKDTATSYGDLSRCPDCGSVIPDGRWLDPKEEGETCPICGWVGYSIAVDVYEDEETGLLVYVEE